MTPDDYLKGASVIFAGMVVDDRTAKNQPTWQDNDTVPPLAGERRVAVFEIDTTWKGKLGSSVEIHYNYAPRGIHSIFTFKPELGSFYVVRAIGSTDVGYTWHLGRDNSGEVPVPELSSEYQSLIESYRNRAVALDREKERRSYQQYVPQSLKFDLLLDHCDWEQALCELEGFEHFDQVLSHIRRGKVLIKLGSIEERVDWLLSLYVNPNPNPRAAESRVATSRFEAALAALEQAMVELPKIERPGQQRVARFELSHALIKLRREQDIDPEARDFCTIDQPCINFSGRNLKFADFTDARIPGADFTGADLTDATFRRAQFHKANFRGANLSHANFDGLGMSDSSSGTNFEDAVLTGAGLRHAKIAGANFHNADLRGADCYRAQISGAKLTRATVTGTDFRQANLTGADLSGVNFAETNLAEADLAGALVAGADFSSADTTGTNFTGVKFDGRTVWTSGFDPMAVAAIPVE